MVMHPSVRRAEGSDAAAVAALHCDSWRRHYRGEYADAYLDGGLEDERLEVWQARLGRPTHTTVTLVAEAEDAVVGFIHAILDNDPRWGSLIENLHVRHDHHRQGLGRRLMSEAVREIRQGSSHSLIHLWVLKQNSRAQAFYRALGGSCVEESHCPAPGGIADRLHGSPHRLRFCWSAESELG